MIFSTVGTTTRSFNRLIMAVDEIAGTSNDDFLIQIGYSTYEPRYAHWFRFIDLQKMHELIVNADIVITHGGFAIISECIHLKKKIVACPRLAKFHEAVNPQTELVTFLSDQGYLIALEDVANLEIAIDKARRLQLRDWRFENHIPELVAGFIKNLSKEQSFDKS